MLYEVITPSVIILSETTSNLREEQQIGTIDRVIEGLSAEQEILFKPEILLTLGGAVVSKKIKALLRRMHPEEHWHLSNDPDEFYMDTYQSLTRITSYNVCYTKLLRPR